jgi:pyruvate/2-oxoglutarate dehydrogenase complex dihydrolipoamide dehydrogenase (E3) component
MQAASQASFKQELKRILQYYETALKKSGVEIKLGTKVTTDLVSAAKPDALVIATGSSPLFPEIPGVHLRHVVQAMDVLLDRVKVEGRVAVIGGGNVGCEVAIFLAERGAQVVLLEMLPYVAHGIPRLLGKAVKDLLKNRGVQILTGRKVVRVEEYRLVCEDAEKRESFLSVDRVVLAVGAKPKDDLAKSLKALIAETYLIGDCLEPRKAAEAIYEGAKVAHQL